MKTNKLIELIDKTSIIHNDVLISIDDFFQDRKYEWFFAVNSCDDDINVNTYYSILKKLSFNPRVYDIKVLFVDIEEGEPYSDTIYVDTSLGIDEVREYFKGSEPDNISAIGIKDIKNSEFTSKSKNKEVLCLWWD